jgi:hypothetical protein
MSKANRLKRKRARQEAEKLNGPTAVKFAGTGPPTYIRGMTTDMTVAMDMRQGQPGHLDVDLTHTPVRDGSFVHVESMYMGGYGPGFRRCPCGAGGIYRNRPCPKCGRTSDEPEEISNRRIEVRELDLEPGGIIRNKHFRNCEIIGPAIFFLAEGLRFDRVVFDVPGNTMESIIWPLNPAATSIAGCILVDYCTFEEGRFINIGFAGSAEVLNELRRIVPSSHSA